MKLRMLSMLMLGLLCSAVLTACNDDDDSPDTPPTPASSVLADQTVSIPMGTTHQTGILTAPGNGELKARVTSAVGSDLQGGFLRVADSVVKSATTGPDFTMFTPTTSGQTWRVQVRNPSGVPIDTTIKVEFVP